MMEYKVVKYKFARHGRGEWAIFSTTQRAYIKVGKKDVLIKRCNDLNRQHEFEKKHKA